MESDLFMECRRETEIEGEKAKRDLTDLGGLLKKHDQEFIEVYKLLNRPNPRVVQGVPDLSKVDDISRMLMEQTGSL